MAFSADRKLLASASHDKSVRLWDAASGGLVRTLRGHSDWVRSVAFSAANVLASAADDRSVRLWDAATGALLEGHARGPRRQGARARVRRGWPRAGQWRVGRRGQAVGRGRCGLEHRQLAARAG